MITYVSTANHMYTMAAFLEGWGELLSVDIVQLSYEDVLANRQPNPGTYIFSDHERLTSREISVYREVANRLIESGRCVLNHPGRALSRFEFLKTLHAAGANRFNVYRPALDDPRWRYPVFLRIEHGHEVVSPLLSTPEELAGELRELDAQGVEPEELLLVEFCDTRDMCGVFRKYSSVVVGDQIVPNGVALSEDWLVKFVEVKSEEEQEEIWRYVYANPHEAYLREVAALAGIQFGRFDYALLDGQPQIWEINTNPYLLDSGDLDVPISLERKQYFAHGIARALEQLDRGS